MVKKMQPEQAPQQQQLMVQNNTGSLSFSSHLSKEDEEISRSALSTFRAKEEEIERKKMEVREKVQAQLGRVEEETKRLACIREVRGKFRKSSLDLRVLLRFWFLRYPFNFSAGFYMNLVGLGEKVGGKIAEDLLKLTNFGVNLCLKGLRTKGFQALFA